MASPAAVVSVPEVRLVESCLNDARGRGEEWMTSIGDIPRHTRHEILKDLSGSKSEDVPRKRRGGRRCD